MKVAAVFVSDRGDLYLPGCIESYTKHVDHHLTAAVTVIDDADHKLGMAGAVRAGFQWAYESGADCALWMEEDFRFNGPVPLLEMVWILRSNSHLAQVSLKRQPVAPAEIAAGGYMEVNPAAYTDRSAGPGSEFVEHQVTFSLNPCVIPRRVLELGWPDGNEAAFTMDCLRAGYSFAVYGRKADPPRVEHVGIVRSQGWRL